LNTICSVTEDPCESTLATVYGMKEMVLHLSDQTYERLITEAAAAQKSPEQWVLERLFAAPSPPATTLEPHTLLAAALDALGFRRLAPEKAQRLSTLLAMRRTRALGHEEAEELHALMTEAEALELESLQRLAAAFER